MLFWKKKKSNPVTTEPVPHTLTQEELDKIVSAVCVKYSRTGIPSFLLRKEYLLSYEDIAYISSKVWNRIR